MAIKNNTYQDGGVWNRALNALPQSQRRNYKEINVAQVNRQYVGTPMYRNLNVFANTHSPTQGHPWANSAITNAFNLVGRWMLNEGSGNIVLDSSGGGDTGTWSGNAAGANSTYYSSPGINSAFAGVFSAVGNTQVTLTPPANLAGGVSKTLTLWFNPTVLRPGEQDIAEFGTAVNNQTFGINLGSGNLIGFNAGGASDFVSGTVASTGTWYFAAAVFDSTTSHCTLYVNANAAGTQTLALNTGTTSFFFGQHLTNATEYFVGQIDDVRIYNVALSSSNITAIYNGLA